MCKSIVVSLICLIPLQALAIQQPTVSELLDKYAQTQDKLYQSFIIRFEVSIKSSSSMPGEAGIVRRMKQTEEYRFDAETKRFSMRTSMWGNVVSAYQNVREDNPEYQSYLWDGKRLVQYARNPASPVSKLGKVHLDQSRKPNDPRNERLYTNAGAAGLRGYVMGGTERIDSILRKADDIYVRNEMEPAGKARSPCYVIDAMTEIGKFTIWIDPEHGYNIARCKQQIDGNRGDIVYGRPHHRDDTISLSLENVRFEKINGFWIPIEVDSKYHRIMGKDYSKSETHLKRTEVKLDVDHDALGSFVPDDIKNGARVFVIGVKGIMYTWQDGELIPNIDEAVIDEIDKMADEILAEGGVPTGLKAGKKATDISPTVSDLLDKYAATQNKLQSLIAKAETKIEHIRMGLSNRSEKENCEFRTDGNRVNHRSTFWDGLLTTKDKPGYKSFLWDGKSFIEYRRAEELKSSRVFVKKHDLSKKRMVATEYKGAPLMGICGGDYERIDSVLGKADTISLQDKPDKIGESECYVIDVATKRGKYTVWIDPEHGYNIAKIEVQRKKGDLVRDRGRAKIDMSFSLKNVRFEQIDAVWVPMEADMQQTEDSGAKITKWHHKRTEMILNPDHDVLGSFVADDISDGTKVKVLGDPRIYVWQNGKPVTEVD